MEAHDREKLHGLFAEALAIHSSEQREAFLAEACKDDWPLRQEIEQLLHAFYQAGNFLASGDEASVTVEKTADYASPVESREDTWVGPYHLLQEIGQGGMGVVYMAEQVEPVRRRVAVKLIRPELGSPRVIARFEAERQALALMDHPNIAKVFDAGTTEHQVPYFVMELVKGVPITKYCDDHRLSVHQRLALMVPIAAAVQHAHQKGIIHRDLKPSNILVAEYDDRPVPKIIDFGVAKAINQSLSKGTAFTSFDQIIGTLEYMSPEQAKFNQLDIDTRSDVYSLGVVLYELLTGTTPFAEEKLKAQALDELLRAVREQEPELPSSRLRGSGSLPSLAALRHVPPARLTTLVRGELDWITMRALEKDRTRRYESATEFGRDIERYMHDQTVSASPPSWTYRIRKFVRRNRGSVISASAITLALAIGGFMLVRGNTVARSAFFREQSARAEAESQAEIAQENKDKAEQAVWDFFMVVSESPELLNLPGTQKLRRKLVGTARDYYNNVLTESASWNEYNRGLIWNRLGMMEDDLGNLEQALSAYQQSLEHWQKLHDAYPTHAEYANNVGSSTILVARTQAYLGQLRIAEASALELLPKVETWVTERPDYVEHSKCLAWLHNLLGLIYTRTDETDTAEKHFQESIRIAAEVLADDPNEILVLRRIAGDLHNLSVIQFRRRQLDAALENSSEAMNYYDKLSELGDRFHQLGNIAGVESVQGKIWTEKGDLASALELHQQAMKKFDQLVKENPHVPEFREGKAKSHNSLGIIYGRRNRRGEALDEFERAIAIREPLVESFPNVSEYARELVKNYGNAAGSHVDLGAADKAIAYAQKALTLAEKLEARDGATPEHRNLVAGSYMELGNAQSAAGQPSTAMESFQRGLDVYQQLAEDELEVAEYQIDFADALRTVGNACKDRGDYGQARTYFEQAVQRYKPYLSGDRADSRSMGNATLTWADLAEVLNRQGDTEAASAQYERATTIARALYANPAIKPESRALLVACLVNNGLIFHTAGNLDQAEELLKEARARAETLMQEARDPQVVEPYLANARVNLAMILGEKQEIVQAQQVYREMLAMPDRSDPKNLDLRLVAHQSLAASLESMKKAEEAEQHLQKAWQIAEQLLSDDSPKRASRGVERAFHAYATHLAGQQKAAQAHPHFCRAIKLCESMNEAQPESPSFSHFAALCIEAATNAETVDAAEASRLYDRGIRALKLAHERNPDSLSLIRELGIAFSKLSKFTQSEGDAGYKQYAQALHYSRLAAEHPGATAYDQELLMKSYTNCAITLAKQGRVAEAIEDYEHAIEVAAGDEALASDEDPLSNWRIPALINLGRLLEDRSRSSEAHEYFERALRIGVARIAAGETSPRVHIETAFARVNVADSLSRTGDLDRALHELQLARERLMQAIAQNAMGSYAFGFLSQAMSIERKCVDLAFSDNESLHTVDQAIQRLSVAATWLDHQLRPWPSGHSVYELLSKQLAYINNVLAWRLATDSRESVRDGIDAVVKSFAANRITDFQSWSYLDTLAAAYAEAGQFERAVKWQSQARDLAPTAHREDIVSRLNLYNDHQAYRIASPAPARESESANDEDAVQLEEAAASQAVDAGQLD